jgi:hypothetical protein
MPSRKQRRRREKTFRHDYGFVTYDEEGNEVEIDPAEVRPAKPKADKPKPATTRGGKPLREPPVPSLRRSLRRGLIWGGVLFVVVVFFFKGQSLPSRIGVGLLYAVAFVPLTYWIDRLAYRNYQRRSGKSPGSPGKGSQP